MPTNEIKVWEGNLPAKLPMNVYLPEDVVPHARQLTARDKKQVVSAFAAGGHEMAASFVWSKALTSLKSQLGKLGAPFLAEMLDRPDINDQTPIEYKLTDFEALKLSRELGIIGGTGAFRLRQSFERLQFFGSLSPEEAEQEGLTPTEAMDILRSCVENILGLERIEAALDFKKFRDSLSSEALDAQSPIVEKLVASPYFFHRASIRMVLALVKSASGAQLENALANANVIMPKLWLHLLEPERYQIGRAYAEMMSEGRSKAASGLKRVLLRVGGFDFVPEDLRSTSFIKAANTLIAAHEAINNFYNEPGPMTTLAQMGRTLPIPAFSVCMSAVLSVWLGNGYGICFDAQAPAKAVLDRVTEDRWLYYFNQCRPADERILFKLLTDKPIARWQALAKAYTLDANVLEVSRKDVRTLLLEGIKGNVTKVRQAAQKLIADLGYTDKPN